MVCLLYTSNKGACTHPCRWKYAVVEESRPGEYLPVYENERGTYIFNSKDLCMIEYIPELVDAGIDSFKIEGDVYKRQHLKKAEAVIMAAPAADRHRMRKNLPAAAEAAAAVPA